MSKSAVIVHQSRPLSGAVILEGAKNSILACMASSLLNGTITTLRNVPMSEDVLQMSRLLELLGAKVLFDPCEKKLVIDTKNVDAYRVGSEIMKKIRASILVMGPLLARFGRAEVSLPGGDMIGARPIDFHLKAFARMGASILNQNDLIIAHTSTFLRPARCVLEYPSVGATENILMAATLVSGTTNIVNAALEPEVIDLVVLLRKMGAEISIEFPASIIIEGGRQLHAADHSIMYDRLEAGTFLAAAAATRGEIFLPSAPAYAMEVFLEKLHEMGHQIAIDPSGIGVHFSAAQNPRAVSFRTMPYPGFPTDLQPLMMAVLSCADGQSVIEETVYENRFLHVRELQRMGAQLTIEGSRVVIKGVDSLYGAQVIGLDIRASAALVVAGLVAQGKTTVTGVHHIERGYANLPGKLIALGASIEICNE